MAHPLRFSLPLLLTCLPGLGLADDDLFLGESPMPEVLTATRLQQAPASVPGSVTVLDRDLIKASGARQITELLRLVPGMLVVPNGNLNNVNYHGSNASQARRLQVLLDGRSVYRAGLAQIDWNDIPVALADIERIEVFRGPNTVSYGANALMAVVSIITRNPKDTHGTSMRMRSGQHGIHDWYASEGYGWESGDLRLSASGAQDNGFDQRADGTDFRDSRRLSRVNLRVTQEVDEQSSLDWQIALKEGTNQVNNNYVSLFPISLQPGEQSDNSDVGARDMAASLRWNLDLNPNHSLYVQTNIQQWERLRSWRTCEAQLAFSPQLRSMWALSPAYTTSFLTRLLSGQSIPATSDAQLKALAATVLGQAYASYDPSTGTFTHACGLVNEDVRENRFDLEIQDTLSLSETLRLVSGMSYRYDSADSETYLNGTLDKDIWRLFSQFEWHMDQHWLLQGGAMLENDSSAGTSLSPRVALNYLITPAHGLRAVYSEAVRSPDMFENDADWQYQLRSPTSSVYGQGSPRFFVRAYGPGDLEQEVMRSRELGYNGHFASLGLNVDIKLFHDQITDQISEPLKYLDFAPTNDSHLLLQGWETEADWRFTPADRLRLTYANTRVNASNPLDEVLTPRHSGTAAWMHDWGNNWSTSALYYGADSLNGYRFERVDLRVARQLHLGGAQLELATQLQQRLDDEPLSSANNNYDSRRVLWFSAELDF